MEPCILVFNLQTDSTDAIRIYSMEEDYGHQPQHVSTVFQPPDWGN